MATLKEIALGMIENQLNGLNQIRLAMEQDLEEDGQCTLAKKRLERWRENTIKLIAEKVSVVESERFAKNKILRVASFRTLDEFNRLLNTIKFFSSSLVVLFEEINQPQGEEIIRFENSKEIFFPKEGKAQVMPDPKKVFVVYGRNRKAYEAMVLFLQAIGLEAIDFYELKARVGGSAFVGNIVRKGMDEAQAVVVLYTPDEYASLHTHLCDQHDSEQEKNRWQPRQNVILEAGMALAISEERTILVVFGNVSLPSDLHGRHYVRLSNSSNSREQLRALLAGPAIGCSVDFTKTTLHNTALAGDFESCFKPPLLPGVSTQSPFQS